MRKWTFKARDPKLAVRIAKDVIKQLDLGKFIAENGTYLYLGIGESYGWGPQDKSFQDKLKEVKNCHVCALGGLFCSYVNLKNKVTVGDLHNGSTLDKNLREKLKDVFDESTLRVIEACFEGWIAYPNISDNSQAVNYSNYLSGIVDPTKRMKILMRNLIKNKGTFIVPKEYRE